DALCERYGISNAHRVLHGALLDSELLADVWLAMTRGQAALIIDFETEEEGTTTGGARQGRVDTSVLRSVRATAREVAEQHASLELLDKSVKGECVWRDYEPAVETEPAAAEAAAGEVGVSGFHATSSIPVPRRPRAPGLDRRGVAQALRFHLRPRWPSGQFSASA